MKHLSLDSYSVKCLTTDLPNTKCVTAETASFTEIKGGFT
jgi:hypothetical protein